MSSHINSMLESDVASEAGLPILDPLYYLDNFELVLDWVRSRYDDVLNAEEKQFIDQFAALPQASRALFVRMVMRKGELFRRSKLHYDEIGDTATAMQALIDVAWVEEDPQLSLSELFDLLLKPELTTSFVLTSTQKQLKKADLLASLAEQAEFQDADGGELVQAFSSWYANADEQVWRIKTKDLCHRLRLIFFGNSHQDWSEFVLSDLGIYQYESIDFSPEARGFQSRRDVDDYLALQSCRDTFDQCASIDEVDHVLSQVQELNISNAWIERRRHKLLFHIGQYAEKQQTWSLAETAYLASGYPGARQRRIRVLEKMGESAAALELLNQALAAPESDAELQQLMRSAPRLNRKLGLQKPERKAAIEIDTLHLELPYPSEDFYVEHVVREHLHQDDAPVFYVENALLNSLLGLLCWPAIFQALPGAFFHPFHRGPVDLTSEDFVQRRADTFAQCFALLDTDTYQERILQTYRDKYGKQSPFVFWEILDEDLLGVALHCIPAPDLKHWFTRILSDIKSNRSGFPDLIQFYPEQGSYQLIEVKGPGDKLQDNQLRLIEFCQQHGLPISVCYLRWQEDTP